jgi:hypothetical protein
METRVGVGNDSEDHQMVKGSEEIQKMKFQGQGQDAQYLTTQGQRSQRADSDDFRLDDC